MHNKHLKYISPLIIICFAILIILPEIMHHAMIIGVDFSFHMNRFYDAAMQMKTGHINLFQSNFGFSQSGRIVNAVYGPITAYFNGILLLISKNLFNYQILTNLIVLIISGILIFILAIKNHVTQFNATFIALMYMGTHPVLAWVTGQQFTGIGAALLPLVLLPATQMIRKHDVNVLLLALSMTILLQVHFMSSVVGAVAIIPFLMVGLFTTNNVAKRKQLVKHTVQAAGLTILLTMNLWANLLEVSGSSHVIPVFPQTDFQTDTITWMHLSLSLLGTIMTMMFALLLIYTVILWRKLGWVNRTATLTGFLFLWLSSWLFPWNTLGKIFPILTITVQLPKRLMVIACILLLLAIGIDLSTIKLPQWLQMVKVCVIVITFGSFAFQIHQNINSFLSDWKTKQVVSSNQNVKSLDIPVHNPKQLREIMLNDNFQKSAPIIQKDIPDYLPANNNITPANYYNYHFRRNYYYQIVEPSLKTTKSISGHQITVKWVNHSQKSKWEIIPLIKYAHSSVKLNGKVQSHIKTSAIGSIVVKARPGYNNLQLSYYPGLTWKLLTAIFCLSWIGLILDLIFRKGKWHHEKNN